MKTAGILTGGGDAPGLNAVMRAVVRGLSPRGWRVLGIRYGWRGMVSGDAVPLDPAETEEWILRGGTVLGTSRTNPYKKEDDVRRVRESFRTLGLEALVALGGEDTLGVAARLAAEGLPVVGVPKTIDNDLSGTDTTFGFDTAVSIATEAIDRLRTTAQSHDRVLVVEVMGRHAGWIALHAGLAGGAHHILVPERPVDVEAVCATVRRRDEAGRRFALIVVAEGAEMAEGAVTRDAEKDAFGHVKLGGIGERIGAEIERRTGHETRSVVLGHVQRGGSPTAYDRVLATRYGLLAADLVHAGRWGTMAALRHGVFQAVSLQEAVAELKTVDAATLQQAEILFD